MNRARARRRVTSSLLGAAAAAWAVLLVDRSAHGQAADVRLIRPDVMLLVDTSGSMEWRTGVANASCVGADGGGCNLCSNGASICSATCPAAERRNRWTTALEVLTGTVQNFSCVERARTDSAAYDYLYPVPYHQPLSGGAALWSSAATQASDGVLDSYRDRVRFGFMSFDNDYRTGIQATDGMFSYGLDRQFNANGCVTGATAVNVGVRRASTDSNVTDRVPGGLISVGPPSADTTQLAAINATIQNNIVGSATTELRPYGGTPIAGMLADAYRYWTTHPDVQDGSAGGTGDPYFTCRGRYNVLITDGQPNMDFRPSCEGGNGICPYSMPDQTAAQMALVGAGSPGAKTFVIAFNASDPDAAAALEPIAVNGGTQRVLYASDRAGLQSALSSVLDSISTRTSTRTAPAFSSASSGASAVHYQFQSSFALAAGYPWEGVLERRRTSCVGSPPAPVEQDIDPSRDDFGYLLRSSQRATPRRLWTYVPPSASTVTAMRGAFAWTTGTATRTLLSSGIASSVFGVSTTTERDQLIAWLRGDANTVRANRPLGDIYHSNPLVVEPPPASLPDQTFTAYRQRTLATGTWRSTAKTVATRESVVYVGTNDGVLHAFNTDTGEEIWGFVPPYLTGSIASMYPANHQYGVDGSPVSRELVFVRSASAIGDASSWRTVLLVGLRGGGGAFEALDVTDPYDPQFLWQFAAPEIASAYGTPALGTTFVRLPADGSTAAEHAIAVLPGGSGVPAAACPSVGAARTTAVTSDTNIANVGAGAPRAGTRCWQGTTGQYLYVVDVQTGTQIARFGPTGSPVIGSPTLYPNASGAVATRAYVGDADGRIWRLDMSDPDPSRWRFGVLFDLFHDLGPLVGQPIVSQPVVTPDLDGSLLVAVGSGDPDGLDGVDENRVAVYRERVVTDSSGALTSVTATRVWELRPNTNPDQGFYAGERLTGALSLFNGVLYFGTFVPSASADACQMGFSRLWGVDETVVSSGLPAARLDNDGNPATADFVRYTRDLNGNGTLEDDQNSVLFGVGITRRPTCVTTSTTSDPYLGGQRATIDSAQGGEFRLVIQSGTGGTSSGGSRTNVVSRTLPTPAVETQINAWAVVFE